VISVYRIGDAGEAAQDGAYAEDRGHSDFDSDAEAEADQRQSWRKALKPGPTSTSTRAWKWMRKPKGAAGKWVDSANAKHGDLLDFIHECCGLRDFSDAVDEAGHFLNPPRSESNRSDERTSPWTPKGSSHSARRLSVT